MAALAAAPSTTTVAPAAAPAPDNNIAATQSANASFAAANPNTFTNPASSPQPSTPPNFNSVSSTNLQPTTPVSLPTPPPTNPNQFSGLVAAGQQTSKSVQDYVNELTPTEQTPAQSEQQSLLDQIANLTSQDTGKAQALINAQQASGATADQTSLTSLNNQLLTQTAQYNNEQANLGGNNGVETSAVLAAQNAGLTKARAADIGLTTAQIQAMQGNLTLAMNTATQAVNAQYSTIEDNIKTTQAQLAALAPILSEDQKTQAMAQQQVLTDQANAVAEAKAAQTQINNVALQAASAGATPDQLAAISNAPDVISAISAAAPLLGAATAQKLQQQQFDNNVTLQKLAISQAQEGIAAENAGTTREEANLKIEQLQNEMGPQALLQYAQQYQATGVMPQAAISDGLSGAVNAIATGQGTANGQPAIPLAPGTIINSSTQVADSKLSADQEQSITQLHNIITNVLPQLNTNFSASVNSVTGLPSNDQLNAYQDTANTLNAAIDALSTAGVLKGTAADYKTLIPNDFWGLNTSAGKRDISNLTQSLSEQLSTYLSSNNLSIIGFSPSTLPSSDEDSANNLSQFVTK